MVVSGSEFRRRLGDDREEAAERDADGDDEERRGHELRDGRRGDPGQDDGPVRHPVAPARREEPGQRC